MDAKTLASKFGLTIPTEIAGDESKAFAYVTNLLQKKPTESEKKVEASNVPANPPANPATPPSPETAAIKSLTLSNRSMRIDALVASHRLTPAEATAMKAQYANAETLSLSQELEGAFNSVMATFEARDPIAALSQESTPHQVVPEEKSVLVAGAQKIAASQENVEGITGNTMFC